MAIQKKDLKYKPLIEAILEVKWGLKTAEPKGFGVDPNYRILLGRFYERIQSKYPVHDALPSASIPDQLVEKTAQHRFRIKADSWPLIQLGPGLLTVNETSGYTWLDFKGRCEAAIEQFLDAYPEKGGPSIEELTLWYIDAVDFDYKADNVFVFLREKLKIKIEVPESLFTDVPVGKNPSSFKWEVSYPLSNPKGRIRLRVGTGVREGKPVLLWETLVVSKIGEISSLKNFPEWLSAAHEVTDDWFFKLIDGDLYKRFSGE